MMLIRRRPDGTTEEVDALELWDRAERAEARLAEGNIGPYGCALCESNRQYRERETARVREVSVNYDAQIYNLTAKRDELLARIAALEGLLREALTFYLHENAGPFAKRARAALAGPSAPAPCVCPIHPAFGQFHTPECTSMRIDARADARAALAGGPACDCAVGQGRVYTHAHDCPARG